MRRWKGGREERKGDSEVKNIYHKTLEDSLTRGDRQKNGKEAREKRKSGMKVGGKDRRARKKNEKCVAHSVNKFKENRKNN